MTFALLVFVFITSWTHGTPVKDLVSRKGADFVVNNKPYRFGGTNCYYVTYQDEFMVDDVLHTAAINNFQVMRVWGFMDIGFKNGSGSVDSNGIKNGIYFQYFDESTNSPITNSTNLKKLDYVFFKAGQMGIRILLTLTNNWRDFGGMDQYVQWRKWQDPSFKANHDSFYNDSIIISWYKKYAATLANRVNSYSKLKYKDDPALFAWELANEPRCGGSGSFPSTQTCTRNYAVYGKWPEAWKIRDWIKEVSAFIKTVDPNHMVAVGDEGFLCESYQMCPDTTCSCYYGVDSHNFTLIESIDFMSLHLYPDQWGKNVEWANEYIANHTKFAREVAKKPVLLGEFGSKGSTQSDVYKMWTDTIYNGGGNGDLFWMISAHDDNKQEGYWVPNWDGYAVYCPYNSSEPKTPGGDARSCPLLSAHAKMMETST